MAQKRPSQLNQLTSASAGDVIVLEDVSVPDVGYIVLSDFKKVQEQIAARTESANVTVAAGDKVFADTSSGSFTVTLPSSPSEGDEVWFVDDQRTWGTNAMTVDGNGYNILGDSTFAADVNDWPFSLVFIGTQWVFGSRT